jgi:hypothetical protein
MAGREPVAIRSGGREVGASWPCRLRHDHMLRTLVRLPLFASMRVEAIQRRIIVTAAGVLRCGGPLPTSLPVLSELFYCRLSSVT